MCPHDYHKCGSMATPALGKRDVRLCILCTLGIKIYVFVCIKIGTVLNFVFTHQAAFVWFINN